MSSVLSGGRRPRVLFTSLGALTVVLLTGAWMVHKVTRVGSGYGFVRGDLVLVGAPMEGQIASIDVVPGQRVKKGDVLARLNDNALRPEVDRAAAAYDRARLAVVAEERAIEVERKRIVAERRLRQEKVKAAEAESNAARIAAKHTRRMAERSRVLASRSYLPEADDDQAWAQADTAEAETRRRRAMKSGAQAELAALTVEEAELEARVDRLGLLRAEEAAAKAALGVAQGRLDLTVIHAQHDGLVTRRVLGPGASIRYSDPIVEMWLDGPVSIEAWVEEREIGSLRVGRPVKVAFPGLSETFTGKIDALAMVSDSEVRSVSVTVPVGNRLAKSRWIRAHITLDNPDERLVPGLSADVTIAQELTAVADMKE
jgi:membrane fusion protein, multidrug efflux system